MCKENRSRKLTPERVWAIRTYHLYGLCRASVGDKQTDSTTPSFLLIGLRASSAFRLKSWQKKNHLTKHKLLPPIHLQLNLKINSRDEIQKRQARGGTQRKGWKRLVFRF